jgi:hypothetical protein
VRPSYHSKLSHASMRGYVVVDVVYVSMLTRGNTTLYGNSIAARLEDGVLGCRRLKDALCCEDFRPGSRAAQGTSLSQEPAYLARDLDAVSRSRTRLTTFLFAFSNNVHFSIPLGHV